MKNKFRGFTLIELLVVMGIIGILACILIPAILGYVDNARVAKLNANAKSVYNAAQLTLTDRNNSAKPVQADCVFTGASDAIAHPNGGTEDLDLSIYLGEQFGGYFAFVTNGDGYGCKYVLWSEHPISAGVVAQMSEQDVKDSLYTSTPRGCYPLLSEESNDDNS